MSDRDLVIEAVRRGAWTPEDVAQELAAAGGCDECRARAAAARPDAQRVLDELHREGAVVTRPRGGGGVLYLPASRT